MLVFGVIHTPSAVTVVTTTNRWRSGSVLALGRAADERPPEPPMEDNDVPCREQARHP